MFVLFLLLLFFSHCNCSWKMVISIHYKFYPTQVELNQVRHMVADISCLGKNQDLRLMLRTKRILVALKVSCFLFNFNFYVSMLRFHIKYCSNFKISIPLIYQLHFLFSHFLWFNEIEPPRFKWLPLEEIYLLLWFDLLRKASQLYNFVLSPGWRGWEH